MATFLMIHGAWHGGWAFDPVRPLLEAAGHKVVTPDLPLAPDQANLAAWSAWVAEIARQEAASTPGGKVVLVGHSRGGVVISAAAERAPELFSALVYIAAFLLPDGVSAQQFLANTPRSAEFDAGLRPTDDGQFLIMDPQAAPGVFAQRCAEQYGRECAPLLRPEPLEPLAATMAVSEARFGSVPRYYVECLDDQALQHSVQREMLVQTPCSGELTLDTDHTPMLSATSALAGYLLEVEAGLRPTE